MYGATPLRVRLVVAATLLVTAALTGSGIAAAATMEHYLVGQIDAQLRGAAGPLAQQLAAGRAASGVTLGPSSPAPRLPAGRDDDRDHGTLPSAYVVEIVDAHGDAVAGPSSNLIDPHQPLPALPHVTAAQSHNGGPRLLTVDAQLGDEQWRVLLTPVTLTNQTQGTLLVAQSLQGVQNTVDRLVVLLLIIAAAAVVIITGIGYLVVRASMRPLRAVELASATIAAGDLSHRVPDADPRTEVGHLAAALNTMLARIESAFADRARSERAARASEERMRQFVADASHELRTPLTTIRGFAELFRQGGATGTGELDRLMRRIEDAAQQMGLLVEDLLLLARLDQERPLAQRPVDLLALTGDAVLSARALEPDRPIKLVVAGTDPPPIVTGDQARLRQVLANLMANALQHTPAGTPVTITVGTARGRNSVVITVADQGPGLAADVAGRVFERFYRADAARDRSGGTGLGLAIVAALVAGHGGQVDVTSQPGAGACFRVQLPLAGAAATPAGKHPGGAADTR